MRNLILCMKKYLSLAPCKPTKKYRMGDFGREIFYFVLCVKKHLGKALHPCKPTEVENKSWRFQRQNLLSYFMCEETFIYICNVAPCKPRKKRKIGIRDFECENFYLFYAWRNIFIKSVCTKPTEKRRMWIENVKCEILYLNLCVKKHLGKVLNLAN